MPRKPHIDELRAKGTRSEWRAILVFYACLAGVAAFVALLVGIAELLAPSTGYVPSRFIPALGFAIASFTLLVSAVRKRCGRLLEDTFICVHCHSRLKLASAATKVTGNCTHCGRSTVKLVPPALLSMECDEADLPTAIQFNAANYWSQIWVLACGASMFLLTYSSLVGIIGWFASRVSEHVPLVLSVLFLSATLTFGITGLGVLFRYVYQRSQFKMLLCRACGKSLWPQHLVVATGRCSRCGKRALKQYKPGLTSAKSPQTTVLPTNYLCIAEYRDLANEWQREINRCGFQLIGAICTGCIAALGILSPSVIPLVWEPIRPWLAVCVALVAIYGFPITLIGKSMSFRCRFPALVCRHCAKPLAQHRDIVVATGNCPHCGGQVIKDELLGR